LLAGFGIDDRDVVARHRLAHAARSGRKPVLAVGHEQVRLRLAVEFVDDHAGEFGLGPVEDLGRERLAAGTDRFEREIVSLGRVVDPHQHADRRRRDERPRHVERRHQREGGFGVEPRHRVADDGLAVVPCGEDEVAERADPRPVGGRPVDAVEVTLEVHRERGTVPDPDAVAVEHPLGWAGRAAGVEDDRGRVGVRFGGVESLLRKAIGERGRALGRSVGVLGPRSVLGPSDVLDPAMRGLDDVFQRVAVGRHVERGSRHVRIGDDDPRAAVVEAIAQGVGAEQDRQGKRDRAELPAREVGQDVLGALGEDDRHAIPTLDPALGEPVREAIGERIEVAERVRLAAVVGRGLMECRPIGVVFSHEIVREVVVVGQVPREPLARRLVAVAVEGECPGHRSSVPSVAVGKTVRLRGVS
jgi:hypothetical protein